MKRKLRTGFLFLAIGLLSLSRTGLTIKLGQGFCGTIEGASPMSKGYDIRYVKIGQSDVDGKKRQIFKWTCDDKNSVLLNKKLYWYPDQFDSPDALNYGEFDSTTTFLDHFEAFTKHESHHVKLEDQQKYWETIGRGVGAAVDLVMPNMSVGFDKFKLDVNRNAELKMGAIFKVKGANAELHIPPHTNTISDYASSIKNSQFRAAINYNMKTYELRLGSPERLKLSEDFINACKALPTFFFADPEPFTSFINNFGTHYMRHAVFGGRLKYSKVYESSHCTESKKKEIETQYREMFRTYTDTNETTATRVNTSYFENLKCETIGGNTWEVVLPYTEKKLQKWLKSVSEVTSTPIEVSFAPIIDLIANQSIRYQLALASVYIINNETVGRYGELNNDVMNKNSFDGIFEPFVKKLTNITVPNISPKYVTAYKFGDFKQYYTTLSDELNGLLQTASVDHANMIANCTNETHEKTRNLTIVYQNVQLIYHLWNQAAIYQKVDLAVRVIQYLRANAHTQDSRWYAEDTGFEGNSFYYKKWYEALWFIDTMVNHYNYSRLSELSLMDELSKHLIWMKEANNKYSNLRTMSCEDAANRERCYTWTMCNVLVSAKWFGLGMRIHQNWRNYAEEVPAVKYLGQMLTPMQHNSWESYHAEFERDKWYKCNKMFPNFFSII